MIPILFLFFIVTGFKTGTDYKQNSEIQPLLEKESLNGF
jgi:hypothetical protein